MIQLLGINQSLLKQIHEYRHENVIAYKEAFFEQNSSTLCIVMEFADGGDLYQKILEHQKNRTLFPEKNVWHIIG